MYAELRFRLLYFNYKFNDKRFLGIPYTSTEKKHMTVDGKTYRRMKREERDEAARRADEAAAAALVVWEEELVDIFGE